MRAFAAFVIACGAALVAIAVWLHVDASRGAASAASWRTVPGQIESSRVVTFRRSGRTTRTHLPDITYRYTVEGRAYTGRRVWLVNRTEGDVISARQLVASLPPGAPVQVHYDPANPAEAALFVETPAKNRILMIALAVIGLVLLGAGAAMILSPFGRRRAARRL